MFTSRRLVPLLLNTRRQDIPDGYIGPKPAASFEPVVISSHFQHVLSDSLLGQSLQAKAFTACTLLSICDRSLFSQWLRRGRAENQPEYLELLRMRDYATIRSTDTQGEIHTSSPTIYANEYTLHRYQLDRLSPTAVRLTRSSGGDEILTEDAAGNYSFRAGDDPNIRVLFKPSLSNLVMYWAALPSEPLMSRFDRLADSQWAVLDLLYHHLQHTLDIETRRGISSIMRSKASASLRPVAFLLLLLSHYDAVYNLRGS